MKKRRVVALLMAAIFMFALLPVITAQADSIGKEAQACKNLGILIGSDKSGVTAEYLATVPTRLTAYIIALRLKGLYEEAGQYMSSTNFTDAAAAGWAKNYLAYAKNTPDLGWGGYPDGRFGINDKINGQAFYKVLLETLGYKQNVDFTYAQTLEFADKIGLVDDADEIRAIKTFTINDIAKGIYRALNTIAAGTDKKLVDILVDKGVFEAEKVEMSGFNAIIQITARLNLESGTAMVPLRDTFAKMGGYILGDGISNKSYEIKKDQVRVKLIEGVTTAYVNDTKVVMEKPAMKDASGVCYVPASFIAACAKGFGYDAEFNKASNLLTLQKSARIAAEQDEIVLSKGAKKSIKVERIYSDIDREVITSQCTFTTGNIGDIIQVGSASGEVTGRNAGNAEIIISYRGKEVDRVLAHVVDVVPKFYPSAYYEQVFETTFRLDNPNYTDGFETVWNKKAGTVTSINEMDSIDTGSSLNILNYSTSEAGVTANLTKLLENRAIKGKISTLKIHAKGIKEGSKLYVTANIKTSSESIKKENTVVLDSKWKSVDMLKIDIPADAQELILDIAAGPNEEIRIDAFTMTSN